MIYYLFRLDGAVQFLYFIMCTYILYTYCASSSHCIDEWQLLYLCITIIRPSWVMRVRCWSYKILAPNNSHIYIYTREIIIIIPPFHLIYVDARAPQLVKIYWAPFSYNIYIYIGTHINASGATRIVIIYVYY